jgi:hypothetical protein
MKLRLSIQLVWFLFPSPILRIQSSATIVCVLVCPHLVLVCLRLIRLSTQHETELVGLSLFVWLVLLSASWPTTLTRLAGGTFQALKRVARRKHSNSASGELLSESCSRGS